MPERKIGEKNSEIEWYCGRCSERPKVSDLEEVTKTLITML